MAAVLSLNCSHNPSSTILYRSTINSFPQLKFPKNVKIQMRNRLNYCPSFSASDEIQPGFSPISSKIDENPNPNRTTLGSDPVPEPPQAEGQVDDLGVKAALSMLKFYKREISPLLPNSCRYVPTCSEYSMIAYKKYGVVKGTILTAWRLCRCNPLGGSGFDPPRWFDEESAVEESD